LSLLSQWQGPKNTIQGYTVTDILYHDTFDVADTVAWRAETADPFSLTGSVSGGVLDIDVKEGFTLWNTRSFSGNVMFEYTVTVPDKGGSHNRVSDLNCFWMATDPAHPGDFFKRATWRKGVFANYYSLNLYYVGYGGHTNTKTRFRKYNGIGDPLPAIIKEYSDAQHLITPNKKNVIRIACTGQTVAYYFNGEKLFELNDNNAYRSGYFGFRTTDNHMRIEDFRVYRIK
jgi:hypothetical protein